VSDPIRSSLLHRLGTLGFTSTPTCPDVPRYLKQRRRVLLLYVSCRQYVGACCRLPMRVTNSVTDAQLVGLRQRNIDWTCGLTVTSSASDRHQHCCRSINSLRWSDHVTPALMALHWLSAVDRVDFKVATPVYRYLARPCSATSVGVTTSRCGRRLPTSTSDHQPTLAGYCCRSFISGCRVATWNNLPETVRSAASSPSSSAVV